MRIFFGLLLLGLPFLSSGQTIVVSDDIPLRNEVAYEVIGELKDRILLFRDRTTEFEIQAFDQQLQKSWKKDLELDKRLPKVLHITATPDDFTLLYRFRSRSHTVLKAHRYDPGANLKDSVVIKDYGFLYYTPDFQVVRSEDKTKLLVYYVEKEEIIRALVYDVPTMKTLWDSSFSPPEFNLSRDYMHMTVSNDGALFMVIEKDNLRHKREEHRYEIHRFDGISAPAPFIISFQGNLTYDVAFAFDNLNQRLVGGGLFSENNPSRSIGYFYLNIDPYNEQNYLLQFHPFQEDFTSTIMEKDYDSSGNNKGISEVEIQDIILRRDGGLLLIGERNREYERRFSGTTRATFDSFSRYIVDYYYDDVFVIALFPDGKTHWTQILHKKQYSQDDNAAYSSFFLMKTPRKLRFFFNDDIRPENTISEYVLNGLGESDRNSVLSTEKLKLRLRFRDALQIGGDKMIIPSERRNYLKLVMVDY